MRHNRPPRDQSSIRRIPKIDFFNSGTRSLAANAATRSSIKWKGTSHRAAFPKRYCKRMPPGSFGRSWTVPDKWRMLQIGRYATEEVEKNPNGSCLYTKRIKSRVQYSARADLRYPMLLPGSSCLFLLQSSHVLGTESKPYEAFLSMFISIAAKQSVHVTCRNPGSLKIYNIFECGFGSGGLSRSQPRSYDVHKASFKGVCSIKRIPRHGIWDLKELFLFGINDTWRQIRSMPDQFNCLSEGYFLVPVWY